MKFALVVLASAVTGIVLSGQFGVPLTGLLVVGVWGAFLSLCLAAFAWEWSRRITAIEVLTMLSKEFNEHGQVEIGRRFGKMIEEELGALNSQ